MFTTIKVYACYTVKIYINKPKNIFSNRGERARCAGPGSAFAKAASSVFPSSDGKAREVAIDPCTVHSTVQKYLRLFVYSECL